MRTVMLVEDMAIFREPIAATLRQCGYRCIAKSNGFDALSALDTSIPDLIILDIAMPEMDGLSFLEAVRGNYRWAGIPVVLLTAMAEKETVVAAQALGISAYLLKSSFSLDEMLTCVNKHIATSRARL